MSTDLPDTAASTDVSDHGPLDNQQLEPAGSDIDPAAASRAVTDRDAAGGSPPTSDSPGPDRTDRVREANPDAERTHRVAAAAYRPGDRALPAAPAPWLQPSPDGNPQSDPRHHPNPTPFGQAQLGQASPAAANTSGPPAYDLSSARLLREARRPPQSGWRRAVYVGSGGLINPGEGSVDAARRELVTRVNQPLHGCYKIAMLSLKGGVGKTTVSTALGSSLASLRGDRVIAVDANPDRGTLSQKIPLETTATVRHLLRDAHRIRAYHDVRAYTSQAASRLEVLASDQDPAVSEAFSERDYRQTVSLLSYFYNCILTDCGTGLMHSAMKGVLDEADALLIVSSAAIDGARSASATLDWLDAHGYGDLVERSVTVINAGRRPSGHVDLERLSAHFAARTRSVVHLGFDPHLEEGAEIDLDRLGGQTREALLELAAVVADDFPHAMVRAGLSRVAGGA